MDGKLLTDIAAFWDTLPLWMENFDAGALRPL